ncbi:bifunctional deaminase-reductase domain protein [Podospora conica]|nr:bifunctional deaminase-reductase domain protein [Schizothecium conicum]
MPLTRYNTAPTLDGFIASPHTTNPTPWIVPDPTIDFPALYASFSHFLMGRLTYETMVALAAADPTSAFLHGRPRASVVVLSATMNPAEHPAVTVVASEAEMVEMVRGWRAGGGKDVWVMGGGRVAGCLVREGVLDVVEVAVMPVVIGEGVRMVEGVTPTGVRLGLEGVERLGTGIVMLRYRVLYGEGGK